MTTRGPWMMVAASATFIAMIAMVKAARGFDYGTLELIGWRSLVGVPLLFALSRRWRVQRPGLVALRCGLGFVAMFCYFAATRGLGVGPLSVLTKLQPLLVAVIAPLALGGDERPGATVWAGLGLGMLGTVALAWPQLGGDAVQVLSVAAGLGAALASSLAHTTLRALRDEDSASVVFWLQVSVGLGALAAMPLAGVQPQVPAVGHLPLLVGVGGAALSGQLLMTRAYGLATAPRVAAAGYSAPFFGFLADATVFGVLPTPASLLGAALIIGAGLLLLRP